MSNGMIRMSLPDIPTTESVTSYSTLGTWVSELPENVDVQFVRFSDGDFLKIFSPFKGNYCDNEVFHGIATVVDHAVLSDAGAKLWGELNEALLTSGADPFKPLSLCQLHSQAKAYSFGICVEDVTPATTLVCIHQNDRDIGEIERMYSSIVLDGLDGLAFAPQIHGAIGSLIDRGIIQGYPDGSLRLENKINRAEFTKVVVNAARHVNGGADERLEGVDCFTDVAEEWFAPFVCTAKETRLIDGYSDGTFRPAQNVNFVEAAKIVANAFDLETVAESSDRWYVPFVKQLGAMNAIPVSITSLDQEITRGEMAEMIYRLMDDITDQPAASADDLLA